MTDKERQEILKKAKEFFKEKIVSSHIRNTKKLVSLSEFNVNPFLNKYLANYLTGNGNPKSIAKALIYPRVLGTSITTSFGTHLQHFCSTVLSGFASSVEGLDIEFIDQIDGRRKYCQIKAGPNTINKDDIKTIFGHFAAIKNRARTNQGSISLSDLIVGVFYGTRRELSTHYLNIDKEHPVIVGQEFWHRLTGEESFYDQLIDAIGEVANEENSSELLKEVIKALAEDIEDYMD